MSKLPEKPQPNLERVIERVSAELRIADSTPFSEHAVAEFNERIEAYAVELIRESVKRAGRQQAEGVSSSNVRHASQYLVSSSSHRFYRHAGTLGGLLFGTALSQILSVITTGQYGPNGIILTFVLGLVGTSLITVHMAKD